MIRDNRHHKKVGKTFGKTIGPRKIETNGEQEGTHAIHPRQESVRASLNQNLQNGSVKAAPSAVQSCSHLPGDQTAKRHTAQKRPLICMVSCDIWECKILQWDLDRVITLCPTVRSAASPNPVSWTPDLVISDDPRCIGIAFHCVSFLRHVTLHAQHTQQYNGRTYVCGEIPFTRRPKNGKPPIWHH